MRHTGPRLGAPACADYAHEKLVAFSCNRRGFCPSCGARRMAESAAHLVDQVIARVPVIIHRVIARFLLKQAGLKRCAADTGAVTLIQRFGSAANLNIHLHCLVLDGVYQRTEGEPNFQEARAPIRAELEGLLEKIIAHLMKMLTRLGYLVEEQGVSYVADIDADNPLASLQAASCTYRIALGPRAGQKVLSLRTTGRDEKTTAALCADAHGFSLHAGVRCGAHPRKELERLCRYITRPAIANERQLWRKSTVSKWSGVRIRRSGRLPFDLNSWAMASDGSTPAANVAQSQRRHWPKCRRTGELPRPSTPRPLRPLAICRRGSRCFGFEGPL
jgi:hypothetical protein